MSEFFTGGHLVFICVCVLVWRFLEVNHADVALMQSFKYVSSFSHYVPCMREYFSNEGLSCMKKPVCKIWIQV